MKLIKSLLIVFSLLGFVIPREISARESFGDFPYEGTYLTEEENALHGFNFDSEKETITIFIQDSSNGMQRILDLAVNDNLATGISPFMDAAEVEEIRASWGLDEVDFEENLQNAADQVEPWMTRRDVLKLIDRQTVGMYVYDQGNSFVRAWEEIMIVKPEIQPSQDLWIVGLPGNPRVLRFETGEDTNVLVDDFGVTYYQAEEDTNEEAD